MDEIYQQVLAIISTIVGSIDVAGIVGVIVYIVKSNSSLTKIAETTKETVEQAFQDAVIPKNIKLDVSSKIETPIKEGLAKIQEYLNDNLAKVTEGEELILQILSLFSHVKQLPEEVQEQIQDYLEHNSSIEVSVETTTE